MHLACGDGNLNLCEYLLEVGGDYDAKDICACTNPMVHHDYACFHGGGGLFVQTTGHRCHLLHGTATPKLCKLCWIRVPTFTPERKNVSRHDFQINLSVGPCLICPAMRLPDGYQPLHYAAKRGWKDIVHMLIEHGADPHSTANTGESVKGSLRGDNEEKKHLEKIIDNAKKSATVRAKQTKRLQDMHSMSVSDLIANHQLTESDAQAYLPALEEMGAEAVADLRWIELDDFESVKLKTVRAGRGG
jgi:ankyrin repeat protein